MRSNTLPSVDERTIFTYSAWRPGERHRRPGGIPELQVRGRQVREVPELLRDEPRRVGEVLQGEDEGLRVVASGKLVVPALPGQERPGAAAARAVERAAVGVVAVAVLVVAMPAGTPTSGGPG